MIQEHERIVLNVAVPAEGLEAGDVGAAVVTLYKTSKFEKYEGAHES